MTESADLTGLSTPVRALAAAVRAVAAVPPADLPGQLAVEELRTLLALSEQLQVAVLGRIGDMDRRGLHDLDAHGSTGSWLAAEPTSHDRGTALLARRLGRLPSVAAALDAGRLTLTAAQRVAFAVEKVRGFLDRPDARIDGQPSSAVLDAVIVDGVVMLYAEALGGVDDDDPRLQRLLDEVLAIAGRAASEADRVEAAFVALSVRIEGRLLSSALQRLIDALLPQQLEDRTERAHRNRGLVLVRHDDRPGGRLEADLDAELYELLETSLTAAMATDPDNVTDTASAAALRGAGKDPYAPGLGVRPRPRMARRHDALIRILTDWLGSGIAGSRGKAVPHIAVTIGLGTLERVPGALPARGRSGAALAVSVVRRWMCDSQVTRFVLSLGHRVLETSHTERTLKRHERQAKLVEVGQRCQAAGCAHPPGVPLIPHHPEAWARSHTTSFYDTVMLCETCHLDLHEGGKTLRLRDGRLLNEDGWMAQIHAA